MAMCRMLNLPICTIDLLMLSSFDKSIFLPKNNLFLIEERLMASLKSKNIIKRMCTNKFRGLECFQNKQEFEHLY